MGTWRYYKLTLTAAADALNVSTSGGSGDVALYVRRGSVPTRTISDGSSVTTGNAEGVTIAAPATGDWYIALYATAAYSSVSLTAGTAQATAFTNGSTVSSLSGAVGTWRYYKLTLSAAADALNVNTSGGSGDVALYVRRGSVPTRTISDGSSVTTGNAEGVTIAAPATGDWYIALYATAAYSSVSLTAGTAQATAFTNGSTVSSLSGAVGTWRYYKLTLSAAADALNVNTSGGSGDVALYVRRGSVPTRTISDGSSVTTGNNEQVTIAAPATGDWYIALYATAAYSSVSLTAGTAQATAVTSGTPVPSLSGTLNTWRFYKITVPTGKTSLTAKTASGTGNVDVYVRRAVVPTRQTWDARSVGTSNTDQASITNPAADVWYIGLYGTAAYSGVTLTVTAQ